jgi:hypothetical protein
LKKPIKSMMYQAELKAGAEKTPCGGCSMHGICIDNKCVCEPGYTGPTCSELTGGALVHRCPASCHGHGMCLFGKCFCYPGYGGEGCDEQITLPCPGGCNSKGICHLGRCFCDPGYAAPDCKKVAPCDAKCGVHGVCIDGRCVCADGFTGEHCNIATKHPAKQTSFIESSESTYNFRGELNTRDEEPSLISTASSTTPTPMAAVELSSTNIHETSSRHVVVTDYSFPIAPLVLLSFVAGVLLSSIAKCVIDKREQMRRQQELIKPLLVPAN